MKKRVIFIYESVLLIAMSAVLVACYLAMTNNTGLDEPTNIRVALGGMFLLGCGAWVLNCINVVNSKRYDD